MRYIISYTLNILFHSEAKITLFYLFLFAFIHFHLLYHSLSSVVICYHLLNHCLSLVVTRYITCCITRCHSLPICCRSLTFVVIRCQSLSLVVPYVVTRCTTRCYSLAFVVIHSHSLPLVISIIIISSLFNVDTS